MNRKPYALYAITKHGIQIAERLLPALPGAQLLVSQKLYAQAAPGAIAIPLPLGPVLRDTFGAYDCHVFVISVGAVVRLIAPLLQDKKIDPAVICVDDAARFAICVLSGHVGRGNAYCDRVAAALGAQSVVTTASDVRGTLTVDILGRELGWTLEDPERNVTRACAAVVNETRVAFVQETGEPNFWPLDRPLPIGIEYRTALDAIDPDAYETLLVVSDRDLQKSHPAHFARSVIYRPKSLILGLGCDRDTPLGLLERGVQATLGRFGLAIESVKGVATIDKKSDEQGLLELCARRGWPLQTYADVALDAVDMPSPSETVKRHVGTRGVAEPSALLASGASRLVVEKQIYTESGAGRSMTLAVARLPFPARAEAKP